MVLKTFRNELIRKFFSMINATMLCMLTAAHLFEVLQCTVKVFREQGREEGAYNRNSICPYR